MATLERAGLSGSIEHAQLAASRAGVREVLEATFELAYAEPEKLPRWMSVNLGEETVRIEPRDRAYAPDYDPLQSAASELWLLGYLPRPE